MLCSNYSSFYQVQIKIDIWFHSHTDLNFWGVDCGNNHKAVSCKECPPGVATCKGECKWVDNACVKKGISFKV